MARRNEISRAGAGRVRRPLAPPRGGGDRVSGRFADEVAPVADARRAWVHTDNLVRADTSVEKLAKLRPVFAKDGTRHRGQREPAHRRCARRCCS